MTVETLDFKQLEAFCAVMTAGGVTGAARLLHRSQPNVSRLIQELENTLGFALFVRNGPRISPTEHALRFHPEAERLVNVFHHVRERAEAIGSGQPPSFEISAISALAVSLVPPALAAIPRELMPRSLHVQAAVVDRVAQSVATGASDFGLASFPVSYPGLGVKWVGEAPCVAALRHDHPLAAKPLIPLRAFADCTLITMSNPFKLRYRVDHVFEKERIAPRAIVDTNTGATALSLAREGLGVAIVDPATAYGMPFRDLVLRPLDVRIPFFFGAIVGASRALPPALSVFSDAVLAAAERLLPGFRLHQTLGADLLEDALYGEQPLQT
ncbi:LysR family transcriptional regulator [Gluconacetobacter aggeris]|uniref:LysR family transcriptional regulator n=1 Tax=Gluconacetobacter aggeris TaxID=1286186 RepID=A0A7W4IUA3_9PROT|nr:LysR family transcriptional regulator [Gluconacetobacter aggeris]MBB2169179.1 LysR family transcriptional regulator [Gluconacetobacter aggeris]